MTIGSESMHSIPGAEGWAARFAGSKVFEKGVNLADWVAGGVHAAPKPGARGLELLPSRHRLWNAAGGIVFWMVGRQIMNVLVGETPKGEKVDPDSLPFFLKPLYGKFAYNRYSDAPADQWKRVIDDLTPAVFGAVGAVCGSMDFFRKQDPATRAAVATDNPDLPEPERPPLMARDRAESLKQAQTWRVLAGMAGIFSASSGLALLPLPFNIFNYGVSLNNAFMAAAGRKAGGLFKPLQWITNSRSKLVSGPAVAATDLPNNLGLGAKYTFEKGLDVNHGQIDQFARALTETLFNEADPNYRPHFNNFVRELTSIVERGVKSGTDPEQVRSQVEAGLKAVTSGKNLDALFERCGFPVDKAKLGNNGFVGMVGNLPYRISTAVGSVIKGGSLSQTMRDALGHGSARPDAGMA